MNERSSLPCATRRPAPFGRLLLRALAAGSIVGLALGALVSLLASPKAHAQQSASTHTEGLRLQNPRWHALTQARLVLALEYHQADFTAATAMAAPNPNSLMGAVALARQT